MPAFPGPPAVISADNQVLLDGFLHGAGTAYQLSRRESIGGLGKAPQRTHDFPLVGVGGADGGDDDDDVRVVTIPLYIATTTYVLAMTAFKTVLQVWEGTRTDVELRMRLPGWGEFYFARGRARGLDPDLSQATFGHITMLARYDALDPVIRFV